MAALALMFYAGRNWERGREVTRDQELWACALAVEREHGDTAWLHAAMEADRLILEGEHRAADVWCEVLKRLVLMRPKPGATDPVN